MQKERQLPPKQAWFSEPVVDQGPVLAPVGHVTQTVHAPDSWFLVGPPSCSHPSELPMVGKQR